MPRKYTLLALVLALTLVGAPQAFAWGNGGPSPNKYGTHDWIIDHAIKNAGADGSWVDRSAALRASDDPDTNKTNSVLHNFRDKTGARGAGQAVADLYYKAVVAYRAGDTAKASVYVGQMSHYYSDALMPFHASYAARNYAKLHYSYEVTVSRGTNHASDKPSWAAKRAPQTVTDVRQEVVSAAAYARGKYPALKKAYASSHSLGNKTVKTNTRLVLNRGVNDLTDIIRSIPEGTGLASTPATMTTWMTKYYPAQNTQAGAWAKCLDANGDPVEGARVTFAIARRDDTVTVSAYTDAKGIAHTYQYIGKAPLMKRKQVLISQSSSGSRLTTDEWYMATPVLASGRDGIAATVSTYRPEVGSTVSAKAVVRSASGKAVAGLPITFYWHYPDHTEKYSGVTDAYGNARSSDNLSDAEPGERVYVEAEVYSGSQKRTSGASFIPAP